MADWHMVRAAHKHVLNGIEHKRFAWDDTAIVIDTKRAALPRIQSCGLQATGVQSNPMPSTFQEGPIGSNVVCQAYQQLNCPFVNDHTVGQVTHMHCCAFCFAQNGFKHTHPQSNCRKSKEAVKGKARRSSKRAKKE